MNNEELDHNRLIEIFNEIITRSSEITLSFIRSDRTNRKTIDSFRKKVINGIIELRNFHSYLEKYEDDLFEIKKSVRDIINDLDEVLFNFDSRSLVLDQLKAAKYTFYTSILALIIAITAIILTLWLFYQ